MNQNTAPTAPLPAPDPDRRTPKRLYAPVPYAELGDALLAGLAPVALFDSRKAASSPERETGAALVTVRAREAEREGVRFAREGAGTWTASRAIPAHLLACRDDRALAELGFKRRASAGGIVVSSLEDPRVLLLFKERGRAPAWKTPKGGIEAGETLEQAALREVAEEAGLARVRVVEKLGRLQYFKRRPSGRMREKTVHLFLMLNEDGESAIAPREGEGFVAHEWLTFDDAIARVTQPQARRLLARAARRFGRRGP